MTRSSFSTEDPKGQPNMMADPTCCKMCNRLRYRNVTVKDLRLGDKSLEVLLCKAGHFVTIDDLKRIGSCSSYSPRINSNREVTLEKQGEKGKFGNKRSRNTNQESKESQMALTAPVGSERKPVVEGLHPAVCVAIYDLGSQHSEKYNSTSRQVLFSWELTDETREFDGEAYNARVSRTYTLSMNPKGNLRPMVESWRGRMTDEQAAAFDVLSLAGQPCMVSTTNVTGANGKTYASVRAVVPVPRGMEVPVSSRMPVVYEMGGPLPEDTPEWIAEKIASAPEFRAA